MSSLPAAPVPGRPRDPGVDERVAEAAIAVFGDVGWSGFTIDAVARRAGVGKASIYLRWPSKEALLEAAMQTRVLGVEHIDTGSTRDDLLALVRQMLHSYLGDTGPATLRLFADADRVPQLRERRDALSRSSILAARSIVRRGIRRGELPPSTSVTVLLDALVGGAMLHAMSTPRELREKVVADADAYAERLVDFVLGRS